jgi:hypothetical protein
MKNLTPLIPGFYADSKGCIHVDMDEFLAAHGLPDAPELRAVIWDEIRDIFGGVEMVEIVKYGTD